MQTIETYFIATCLIWIWVDLIRPALFMRTTVTGYVYRNKVYRSLDQKPINCGSCLSFWTGIILCCCTFHLIYLTLPIGYKLLSKHI